MRSRFWAKILFLVLLSAGIGIGDDRERDLARPSREDEGAVRRVTVFDCTFERNPDSFTEGLRRTMEGLSVRTEKVTQQRQAFEAGGDTRRESVSLMNDDIPARGYIDEYIFGKMRQDGIPHAGLCTDAEFMRRAMLDLTGRIPSAADLRSFVLSDDPLKRSRLIKSLIGSPEFVDRWTMYYGDLLKNTTTDTYITRYAEGRNSFYRAIRNFVESAMPYDLFVRKLLTASGSTWDVGEGNWAVGASTPMGPIQDTYDTLAVRAATQFLGLSNMDCLLCHSGAGHLDRVNLWAAGVQRSQAWQIAAFFSRFRFTRSANQASGNNTLYYWTISDAATGDYSLNTTSGNRTPRQPLDSNTAIKPVYFFSKTQLTGTDYRGMFADHLVNDRQFARAAVNYLWQEMMGAGIVEPADQFDLARLDPWKTLPAGWTVQPSHPELLETLTDDFIRNGFNIRYILGLIADSSAYQLSSRFQGDWKVEYAPYFARKYVRRLRAEEIHDAIAKSTNVPGSYTVQGFDAPVVWAMQLPETAGPNNVGGEPRSRGDVATFMNYFLRGDRDQSQRSGEATIFQALNMMNNSFVLSRARNATANSTVNKLLATKGLTDSQLIEELYLNTLSRFPTAWEMKAAKAALQSNRVTGTENLAWVLLNKIDFLYNY